MESKFALGFMLAVVAICSLQQQTLAFPTGAPESACKELKPGHGHEAQASTANPFQLSQDKADAVSGEQIKVTLSSSDETTFKGLIVQAVDERDEPVGKFLAGKGLRALSCSAVTHSDREAKKTATLIWEAPAELKDRSPISFRATVVHKFDTFYMDIKSKVAN